MLKIVSAAVMLSLLACRGEPPPRDYQNNPPAMTHPVTSSSQSPAQNGMPGPSKEPTSGAEGQTTKPINPIAPTVTLKDQAPATGTVTATTGTAKP